MHNAVPELQREKIMTVLALKDIKRKESAIYYRRQFSANASYQLPGRKSSGQIEFTIEMTPLGYNDIQVDLVDSVDYPVIQVKRALKDYISKLDTAGKLP